MFKNLDNWAQFLLLLAIILFSVDFSAAGTLEQDIKIINPSGVAVVYDSRELGYMWRDYIYEPEEPGNYQIYISYGGFEVPGRKTFMSLSNGTDKVGI